MEGAAHESEAQNPQKNEYPVSSYVEEDAGREKEIERERELDNKGDQYQKERTLTVMTAVVRNQWYA
jgi:hypothetical protein